MSSKLDPDMYVALDFPPEVYAWALADIESPARLSASQAEKRDRARDQIRAVAGTADKHRVKAVAKTWLHVRLVRPNASVARYFLDPFGVEKPYTISDPYGLTEDRFRAEELLIDLALGAVLRVVRNDGSLYAAFHELLLRDIFEQRDIGLRNFRRWILDNCARPGVVLAKWEALLSKDSGNPRRRDNTQRDAVVFAVCSLLKEMPTKKTAPGVLTREAIASFLDLDSVDKIVNRMNEKVDWKAS